jgi:hypothetical protein
MGRRQMGRRQMGRRQMKADPNGTVRALGTLGTLR